MYWTLRYIPLEIDEITKEKWDQGIELADKKYRKQMVTPVSNNFIS
jgi:hypothetical protein